MTNEPRAVEFRDFTAADADAVLALWQRANAVPRPTDRADALLKRLEFGDDLFVIAVAGDEIVGSLIGGWDGWRGGLYRLAVDPAVRRTGVATRLVREVEARLKRAGAERVPIRVFFGEPGAVRFWESVGYQPDKDEAIFVKDL
jgi:ribosomal protein S18 acetylase RimI-like enzyme